jgi:hypothetical protein
VWQNELAAEFFHESAGFQKVKQPRTLECEEMTEVELQYKKITFLPGNQIHSTATKEVQQLEHSWDTDDDLMQLGLIHGPDKIFDRGTNND